MSSRIPTLDIRRFEHDREAFVAELGAAYREWGFAGISHHGIPQQLIDNAYAGRALIDSFSHATILH